MTRGRGGEFGSCIAIAWTLGQRYGTWIWRVSSHLPTFRTGLATLRDHAARSAELSEAAGCSVKTNELIRNQEKPTTDYGRLLLEADEAN